MTANQRNVAIPVRELAQQLAVERSPERRSQVATTLGTAFASGVLSEAERLVATKIFELLARDVASEVRRALSQHIKSCPFLPRAIAQTLAQDIETVAIPVLRYSTVLTEDDLRAIIAGGNTAKQIAIAERESVEETVAEALVETGNRDVVGTLLANVRAKINETSLQKVVDTFGEDRVIQALLVDRPRLPVAVTARLVSLISGQLQERLVARHGLPEVLAEELAQQGKERALLEAISRTTSMREMEAIVGRLRDENALTPTLLLRALCVGKLDFFIAGITALARIPHIKARALMHDFGGGGFRELYKRSGLPTDLETAFRIALEIVLEIRRSTAWGWESTDTDRIIQRLVRVYDHLDPESLESVLCQLDRRCLATSAATRQAHAGIPGSPYLCRPLRSYSEAVRDRSHSGIDPSPTPGSWPAAARVPH